MTTTTVEHVTTVCETTKSTRQAPQWAWDCTCGESGPSAPTTSKGAAGFSASAHVKKATGQPVFAKKSEPAPVRPLQDPRLHAATVSGDPVCGADTAVVTGLAFHREKATCPDCVRIMAEAPAPTKMTHVLPATQREVPDGEYAVDGYREWKHASEGPAFHAYLTRNGKRVAEIDYTGTGGDTDVAFLDVPGGYPYADSPEKDAFKAWVDRFTGVWDAKYNLEWCFAGVLDVLVSEAALVKELNGKRTRTPLLPAGQDPSNGYATLSTRDAAAVKAFLTKRGEANTTRVWDGQRWALVSEVAA